MPKDRARLAMASVGHELNIVVHDDLVPFGLLIFLSSHMQSQFADHLI